MTNRLRTEGTKNMIDAAPGAALISQSFAGWPYERSGGPVKTEADPLDPDPPKGVRETHAAIRKLERLTIEADGIVLRYGGFYGPASDALRHRSASASSRSSATASGVWSFLHTDDIATATLAAIEHGRRGEIYNIVDDEPAPVEGVAAVPRAQRWARRRRARSPPGWRGCVAGPAAVAMMTESRGASNAKAKRGAALDPTHPSWRASFDERGRRAGTASAGGERGRSPRRARSGAPASPFRRAASAAGR